MSIKISVVVPIYKVEAYLEECIESIIHQSYNNLEIILVDDGSPDRCPEICDEYALKDSRIVVIHKENGGLVSARKAGAKRATGNYVCCIDGDDYIAEDYIKKMAEAAEESNADVVCCGCCFVSEEEKSNHPIPFRPGVYDRLSIEKDIFPFLIQSEDGRYFPLTLCMKAIRSSIYIPAQLRVDPDIICGEDQACAIPCIYKSNCVVILKDCLYYYRQHGNSVTKKSSAPWNGFLKWMEHIRAEIDLSQYDFQEQFYRRVVHEFYSVSKSQFLRDEPYKVIRDDIHKHSNIPLIREAVKNAHFTGSIKMKLIMLALKNQWVYPIYVAAKLI